MHNLICDNMYEAQKLTAIAVIGVLLIFVVPNSAEAHIRLLPGQVSPRSDSDSLKVAPCGGIPRTNISTIFYPGTLVTLEWEETIEHPGHFRIAFSESQDAGFDQQVLLDNIIDIPGYSDLPHYYRQTVQLPNLQCDECTLQIMQVMTDRNPPSNYYSCADVQLSFASSPSDINQDGKVNSLDLGGVIKDIGLYDCSSRTDLNHDCVVDVLDIQYLILTYAMI